MNQGLTWAPVALAADTPMMTTISVLDGDSEAGIPGARGRVAPPHHGRGRWQAQEAPRLTRRLGRPEHGRRMLTVGRLAPKGTGESVFGRCRRNPFA